MQQGGPTHRANQLRRAGRRDCEGRSIALFPKRADLLAHGVRKKCESLSTTKADFAVTTANFDRFESHPSVVAGLVPATPIVRARSNHDRGGRDKPGHDAREAARASIGAGTAVERLARLLRNRVVRRRDLGILVVIIFASVFGTDEFRPCARGTAVCHDRRLLDREGAFVFDRKCQPAARLYSSFGVSSSTAPGCVRESTNAMESMKRPGSGEAKSPLAGSTVASSEMSLPLVK